MTRRALLWMLTAGGCIATSIGAVAGNGQIGFALGPMLVCLFLILFFLLPTDRTVFALVFLGLALDTPSDAAGMWQSPVAPLGRLLTENLNKTISIESLRVSALAILLVTLLVVLVYQRGSRSDVDALTRSDRTFRWTLVISLTTLAILCGSSIAAGGDGTMMNMQVQRYVLMIVTAYLVLQSIRRSEDYRVFGHIIVCAAAIKALMAVWIRYAVAISEEASTFATTHGDSMLFASATAVAVAAFCERPTNYSLRKVAVAVPLILLGVAANSRRLAWMEIGATLLTLYGVSPWTRGKRSVTRFALALSPAVLLYVAVGWNSNSRVFGPVHLLRSVQDEQTNRSTLDRDIEDFNLVSTFADKPSFGAGLGQPYAEVIKGDDISRAFPQYRYVPHNSVLWLWSAGGLLGFLGIWSVPVVGIFLATRAYRRATSADIRVSAFVALAALEIYMIQCWGDMGFNDIKSIFIAGPALGIAGRVGFASLQAPGSGRSLAA